MSYKELQEVYNKNFSLGFLGYDISNKLALISLTCYLVEKLRDKNPNITYLKLLRKLNTTSIPDKLLEGLSVICEDLAYGCHEFPTFNIKDKDIPGKIQELLQMYIPF